MNAEELRQAIGTSIGAQGMAFLVLVVLGLLTAFLPRLVASPVVRRLLQTGAAEEKEGEAELPADRDRELAAVIALSLAMAMEEGGERRVVPTASGAARPGSP
ncbi:MAG: hypothetical protein HY683_00765 [Chloroflexi bacterium]|nr:hypothetical protein [Chloroflexota bacterium]